MAKTKEIKEARGKKPRLRRQSQFSMVMGRLMKNRIAVIGLVLLLLIIFSAVFAPILSPYSPTEMDYANMLATPSWEHPFGTDALGRDLLSRVLYGGRYSLLLGFSATVFGSILGTVLGLIIGYAGGRTDMLLMRVVDIIAAILVCCWLSLFLPRSAPASGTPCWQCRSGAFPPRYAKCVRFV